MCREMCRENVRVEIKMLLPRDADERLHPSFPENQLHLGSFFDPELTTITIAQQLNTFYHPIFLIQ